MLSGSISDIVTYYTLQSGWSSRMAFGVSTFPVKLMFQVVRDLVPDPCFATRPVYVSHL